MRIPIADVRPARTPRTRKAAMTLKEYPVWIEGVSFPREPAGQALPARVDVAIIGAGYTGLA
ncbi:MAG TPA: hypothetical protein PLO33_18435, partial [Kouleothrix sp.]|nr:hypothetical protein [Kouleothrix sp.]